MWQALCFLKFHWVSTFVEAQKLRPNFLRVRFPSYLFPWDYFNQIILPQKARALPRINLNHYYPQLPIIKTLVWKML
jgi:hypothetical protein